MVDRVEVSSSTTRTIASLVRFSSTIARTRAYTFKRPHLTDRAKEHQNRFNCVEVKLTARTNRLMQLSAGWVDPIKGTSLRIPNKSLVAFDAVTHSRTPTRDTKQSVNQGPCRMFRKRLTAAPRIVGI